MHHALGGFVLTTRRVVIIGAILVSAVALIWFRDQLDLKTLHDHAGEFNPFAVVLGLIVLPLFGFPVSLAHAITGAKFGLPLGLMFVGISIALQLCASYGIVRLFPNFFARRFEWLRRRLPPATHRSLTLFTMLLPGAPYFAQNYTLPVAGVPFAIFFCYSSPINFARSIVGVIFGEWSGDMTAGRVAMFVTYTITITLACAFAFRRLRAQLRNRPPAENDLTQCEQYGHAAQ